MLRFFSTLLFALFWFACSFQHAAHASDKLLILPKPENPHKAGFGGGLQLATLSTQGVLSSGSSSSLAPTGYVDFRTWTDRKIFGFSAQFGMNVIALSSRPSVGLAPAISLDFGLVRHGALVPYLGVKLQLLYITSGGLLVEIQPHFGVEMFLFLQQKMSLYLEVGVPITIPATGGGVVVELGGLTFGFRYYI